ncbi:hypothetical protein AX17_004316 [Amanita inopinata Kibby_2008]|nr:hypothetical protein AX17_004316 [Amanita inopinata Kibby_2008]
MAANLKRKRGNDVNPRRDRRVDDEMDVDGVSSDGENNKFESQDDGSEEGGEDGENGAVSEGEWSGIQGTEQEKAAGDKSRQPPTGEELRAIKDAADLYRSNSFKLQIDALLPNVRPKTSRQPPLDRFLLSLHSFLLSLPSTPLRHPLEAARSLVKKGVSVPYTLPLPTEDTNWKVAFEKPSDILLVGSWANKVSVKDRDGKRFGVDVAVEMPDDLFQEKDYLNGRFFQKRAFYLATIAAALKESKQFNIDLSYDSVADDPRLTSLVLVPRADGLQTDFTKLNAQVHIIPVISDSCPIPLSRLSPSHSNIRIKSSEDNASSNPPTPIYNTCLLQCLTPKSHLLAVHSLKQDSPAFSDALTLLRIWANQRGYGEGSRMCVHGFKGKGSWWAALLHLSIRGEEAQTSGVKGSARRPLGRGLSSYQMFRAALDILAKFNPQKDAIFVKSDGGHRFPPEEYRAHHHGVFVDSASLINFFAGVPRGSLELLSLDAWRTLQMLDVTKLSGDPFSEVFLKEHRDLPTRYDVVLRVDLSNAKERENAIHATLDHGSAYNALILSLDSLLHQGLGNRSRAITILHPSSPLRPLTQANSSIFDIIYIGIIYDPEHAFRLVDHGPAADEQDQSVIQAFRDFWGDKAELRRFKDGRILESIVWDVKTADEKMHIPAMIVQHVLHRHLGLKDDAVTTWQTPYDSMLRLPQSVSSIYVGSGAPVGFKAAIDAFEAVAKSMKALDNDLPLALVQVSPVSEFLRYTSVFSPVALPSSLAPSLPPNARFMSSMDIMLQFEKSAKWPDDLKAIQKMKLAFFEQLATRLMATVRGLKASVVVGDGVHESGVLDKAFLDIVTPEGWAFSARLWHDREATLLDRILDTRLRKLPHITLKADENKNSREYQEALEAKETYTKRFIHAPRHHRAIAVLCHSHSAFSGTVRLVKRWLASHWLLHEHISEEAVEIICASLFARNTADQHTVGKPDMHAQVPGSKERGFACIIEFLKDWKWEDGLFVPLYADSQPSVEDIKLGSSKHTGSGAWKISTEMDSDGKVWTSNGPDAVAANRVRALAKAAWERMQQMEHGRFDVKSLFTHPTEDYDFVIKLDRAVIPRYFQNVVGDTVQLSRRGKNANLSSSDESNIIRPGFDPVQLLFKDLQRIYADTFRLFYDIYGGDQFGGVWDPSLKQARPFRVLGGFSSAPASKETDKRKDKDKGMVVLNEDAILSEIERLAGGLIKEITMHT